jgi:hypothetical protein
VRAGGEARIGVCRCASCNSWDAMGPFGSFFSFTYMSVRGVCDCVVALTFSVFILDSLNFFFLRRSSFPTSVIVIVLLIHFFLSKGNIARV